MSGAADLTAVENAERLAELHERRREVEFELGLREQLQDALEACDAAERRCHGCVAALVRLHRLLYPERYLTLEEMAAQGIAVNADGVHEWSADTPEQLAAVLEFEMAGLRVPFADASAGATR